jgi:KaiC/GvpD/RAD55 family RecA-like ATPase
VPGHGDMSALSELARRAAAAASDDSIAAAQLRLLAKAEGVEVSAEWKDESFRLIAEARQPGDRGAAGRNEDEHDDDGLDLLDELHANELLQRKLAPIDAVCTPFVSWSSVCRDEGGGEGWARGWHLTAAARTGVGKSVFALNAAWAAMRQGHRVLFVSLEMSQPQLETRMLAIASGLDVRSLEQGPHLDPQAHQKAAEALTTAYDQAGGQFISNRRQLHSLKHVERTIRRAAEYDGARLVIVDYLQLAAADPNDPREVTIASHAVRRLAQDLNITTLALSQFNRETSKDTGRPTVHGLMGGSAIENDSDQVLLLDHSRMTRVPAPGEGWQAYALLAKNRHGPTVEIPIEFSSRTLRMRERQPDEMPARRVG